MTASLLTLLLSWWCVKTNQYLTAGHHYASNVHVCCWVFFLRWSSTDDWKWNPLPHSLPLVQYDSTTLLVWFHLGPAASSLGPILVVAPRKLCWYLVFTTTSRACDCMTLAALLVYRPNGWLFGWYMLTRSADRDTNIDTTYLWLHVCMSTGHEESTIEEKNCPVWP